MKRALGEYIDYLIFERDVSRNTLDAYTRDLEDFAAFAGDIKPSDMNEPREVPTVPMLRLLPHRLPATPPAGADL